MRISFSLLEMRNIWHYVVIVPTGPYLYITHEEVGGLNVGQINSPETLKVKSGAAIPINQKSVFCCYSDLWSSVRDDDFESNFTLREVPDNITLTWSLVISVSSRLPSSLCPLYTGLYRTVQDCTSHQSSVSLGRIKTSLCTFLAMLGVWGVWGP